MVNSRFPKSCSSFLEITNPNRKVGMNNIIETNRPKAKLTKNRWKIKVYILFGAFSAFFELEPITEMVSISFFKSPKNEKSVKKIINFTEPTCSYLIKKSDGLIRNPVLYWDPVILIRLYLRCFSNCVLQSDTVLEVKSEYLFRNWKLKK